MPIHGEYRHLARHAAHAAAEGVPGRDVLVDGARARALRRRRRGCSRSGSPTGRVYTDRDALLGADIGALVVKDRRLLAEAGLCIAVLAVERASGAVVRGPELFARGVAGFEGAEDAAARRGAARPRGALAAGARRRGARCRRRSALAIRRFFRRETGKKPTVLPVVLELG